MTHDQPSMRERMLAGELYVAQDLTLAAESTRAQLLCEQYNSTSIVDAQLRTTLLKQLLGEVGERVEIRPPFHVDYGIHISVGAGTFINFGAVVLDVNPVVIGNDVQMGPRVQLVTATHPLEAELRRTKWEGGAPITIGDNVWIGAAAVICPGVTIGENTVVGAGAVVVHDLPADVVAVGVPARVIKTLPADSTPSDSLSPTVEETHHG